MYQQFVGKLILNRRLPKKLSLPYKTGLLRIEVEERGTVYIRRYIRLFNPLNQDQVKYSHLTILTESQQTKHCYFQFEDSERFTSWLRLWFFIYQESPDNLLSVVSLEEESCRNVGYSKFIVLIVYESLKSYSYNC